MTSKASNPRALHAALLLLACAGLANAGNGNGDGKGKGKGKPNIVWVLTDDQDQMLGASFPPTAPNGATPMPKTKNRLHLHDTGGYCHVYQLGIPTTQRKPARPERIGGFILGNSRLSGP